MYNETINIVIPCFDRADKLQKLLESIRGQKETFAKYKLWFLVDFSDSIDSVVSSIKKSDLSNSYEIIERDENFGLKKNILEGTSEIFRKTESSFLMLLEDDLLLSKYAFHFVECVLTSTVFHQKNISGFSLYSQQKNPWNNVHFVHSSNEPFFLMQMPSSYGAIIKREHWDHFFSKLSANYRYAVKDEGMTVPNQVVQWNRDSSWKREMINYMIGEDLYFIYPKVSYTAHIGNLGTNVHTKSNTLFNSSLASTATRTEFDDINTNELEKYDVFCEVAPTTFSSVFDDAVVSQLNVDLYGLKPVNEAFEYTLTSKNVLNSLESFGFELECIHQNIEYKIEGKTFNLVRTKDVHTERSSFFDELFEANYSSSNKRKLIAYLWRSIMNKLGGKL